MQEEKNLNMKLYNNLFNCDLSNKMFSNEFVLPEKWYVEVTEKNKKILNKFKLDKYKCEIGDYNYVDYNGFGYFKGNGGCNDYTKITFDQFKKYVLKEDIEENVQKLPFKIGDKPKFEVGKWYKSPKYNRYICFKSLEKYSDYNRLYYSTIIYITNGEVKYNDYIANNEIELDFLNNPLTDLSEIQQYLPDGHSDKVETIPEYIECVRPDIWERTIKMNDGKTIFHKEFISSNGYSMEYNYNDQRNSFKPSTKEAYDAQFKPKSNYDLSSTITRAVKANNPSIIARESEYTLQEIVDSYVGSSSCSKYNFSKLNKLGCQGLQCENCLFDIDTYTKESVINWLLKDSNDFQSIGRKEKIINVAVYSLYDHLFLKHGILSNHVIKTNPFQIPIDKEEFLIDYSRKIQNKNIFNLKINYDE